MEIQAYHLDEQLLLDNVMKIIGPGGYLESNASSASPFKVNENQIRYATAVAKGLARKDPHDLRSTINLLQAGTGTGKTLGYLVPAMLFSAMTGKRIAVSTFSRALQLQVLHEAHRIIEPVAALTGVRLSSVRRLGRQNYVSKSGIERTREAVGAKLTDDDLAFLDDLEAWCDAKDEAGKPLHSGLISDFLEQSSLDALPVSIDERLIGLSINDTDEEHAAYYADVDRANSADILITNHALTISNALRWGALLGSVNPIHALIVDEADVLPAAAASMVNNQISFFDAKGVVDKVSSLFGVESIKNELSKLWSTVSDLHQLSTNNVLSAKDGPSKDLALRFKVLANACEKIYGDGTPPASVQASQKHRDLWSELGALTSSFHQAARIIDKNEGCAVLSWSPVLAFPRIHLGFSNPGNHISKLWANLKEEGKQDPARAHQHILFTSATLAVPGRMMPIAMHDFMREVGINQRAFKGSEIPVHYVLEDLMSVIEPGSFGKLKFVLADTRVPTPFTTDSEETVELNDDWCGYTATMISAAAKEGGNTLVLLNSYRDLDAIAPFLPDEVRPRLIMHRRGLRLVDLLKAFKSTPNSILMTPGGWEGVDLPGIIKHLVIPRIPYSPVQSTEDMLRLISLRESGFDEERSNIILLQRRLSMARKKIQQGMGRPIRSATDDATVWIADPRFPHPGWVAQSIHPMVFESSTRRTQHVLADSIPSRFKNTTYQSSKIFLQEQEFLSP